MAKLNFRGSIGIFIVLIGLLIAVTGIIGGAYYVKTYYLNPSLKSSFSDMPQNTSQASSSANLATSDNSKADQLKSKQTPSPSGSPISTLPGKIYYMSNSTTGQKTTLMTATPDYLNPQPLSPTLNSSLKSNESIKTIGVSPDKSLVIVKTMVPAENNSRYDKKSNRGDFYYLISKDGKSSKLDFDKIVTPYVEPNVHQYGTFTIYGFSFNGKKLLGLITLLSATGDTKGFVFDYDIESSQVRELFNPEGAFLPFFYDSDKQLIAYKTSKPKEEIGEMFSNNNMGLLLNLQDKTTARFNDPLYNTSNSNQNALVNFIDGNPYFITADKDPEFISNGQTSGTTGYFEYKNRRTLWVNSFYNPANKGIEVKLDAPEDMTYGSQVVWSPDFNYFAVEVHKNASPKEGNQVFIYSKLGKLIAKAKIGPDDFVLNDYFSPDSRYLLIDRPAGRLTQDWRIFDTKEQKYVEKATHSVGTALYWAP